MNAPTALQDELAQLADCNDAALRLAASTGLRTEQRERLAWLQDKRQRAGLTQEERDEENALVTFYRKTLLIRAQAALLLMQRGYDVSDPSQFHPVD